jgi:putative DNA-invertase from lambdoid prophage Rac
MRAALYLRVSTEEQTTANQRQVLEELAQRRGWRVERVVDETASGAGDRPLWRRLMTDARHRAFDVVVVWALDRIGRSMHGTIADVVELDRVGVDVVSYSEPWLDMRGPTRTLLIAVFSWVAEQERDRLVERTKAGMERARRQGKRLGPPIRVNRNTLAEASTLVDQGYAVARAARELGLSEATLRRYRAARHKGGGVLGAPDPRQMEIPGARR